MAKYCITGSAGFIGFHLAQKLLQGGHIVCGIDNLNKYYDVKLKQHRLSILNRHPNFTFYLIDILDKEKIQQIVFTKNPDFMIHLAAQAGVRYSLKNPAAYIDSNIIGFHNILEIAKEYKFKHLVYASSSSVYGANTKVPFSEKDNVDNPVSLYAATKKSNELMAYTYSHLYNIPTTGLRFFTVYGPMGRPDMAYFSFVDKYFAKEPIQIFNNGDFANDMYRDFTYVDDIVEGIVKVCALPPTKLKPPYRILNIGNNTPEKLMTFITTLEECLTKSLGRKVVFEKKYEPIKQGDVWKTYADTTELEKLIGFKPKTTIKKGLQNFTNWYVGYYKVL